MDGQNSVSVHMDTLSINKRSESRVNSCNSSVKITDKNIADRVTKELNASNLTSPVKRVQRDQINSFAAQSYFGGTKQMAG